MGAFRSIARTASERSSRMALKTNEARALDM